MSKLTLVVSILASCILFSCGDKENNGDKENKESSNSKLMTQNEDGTNNDGDSPSNAKQDKNNSVKSAPEAPALNATPDKYDPAKDDAEVPAGPLTEIKFEEYKHDFGVMDEGDAVTHYFKFTNTGSEPLILEKCKGSCGCTVPECPKVPIAPGATGKIEVKFNSKGKKNQQTKKVTVTANTDPAQTILTIMANVTPAVTQ